MRLNSSRLCAATAVLCLLLAACPTLAQLPAARLLSVFPPGARAGTDVEPTFGGIDLDDAEALRFSHAGIHGERTKDPAKFNVHVAPDVPVGTYEVRVIGRYGVSNPRAFVVGQSPEMSVSPHHGAAEATEIPWRTTLNAIATSGADDWFKLTARKGQRVLVECASREIDSRFEPVLTLIDSDGREMQHARRTGLLDFVAPSDGTYFLEVHDLLYRGGPEYFYRLTAGDGPHIDFIFPPAGIPGTNGHYALYGRNLPGGTSSGISADPHVSLERVDVEIDLSTAARPVEGALSELAAAGIDGVAYRLRSDCGTSNPAAITFASAPIVIDASCNEKPVDAQKVSPPCEIVGRFRVPQRRAWYTFDASKGDVYRIEAYCNRIGSPCDPFLLVERVLKNEKGESQTADVQEVYGSDVKSAATEFPLDSRDPALRFEARHDGAYRVEIRDLFERSAANGGLVYRLAIRREQPDFRLVALAEAPPPLVTKEKPVAVWNPLLRRGGTVPIKVLILRRDGFSDELELRAEGLPPGVTCPAVHVPQDATVATLLLTADDSAAGWVGPVRFIGKSIGDPQLEHDAIAGSVIWGTADPGTPARSRCTADLVLAVSASESEPLSIRAGGDAPLEAAPAGKVQVPFKIIRRGDFKAPMKLRAFGLPRELPGKEVDLGPVEGGTYELDLAPLKLPPGSYSFCLQSLTQGKYVRGKDPAPKDVTAAFYSNPITIKVKP